MTKLQIDDIVLQTVKSYCESIELEQAIDLNTKLVGTDRLLDSMGLVNVIIDIESVLLENDIEISIISESAMSSKISPFRTISSLSNYIFTNITENE